MNDQRFGVVGRERKDDAPAAQQDGARISDGRGGGSAFSAHDTQSRPHAAVWRQRRLGDNIDVAVIAAATPAPLAESQVVTIRQLDERWYTEVGEAICAAGENFVQLRGDEDARRRHVAVERTKHTSTSARGQQAIAQLLAVKQKRPRHDASLFAASCSENRNDDFFSGFPQMSVSVLFDVVIMRIFCLVALDRRTAPTLQACCSVVSGCLAAPNARLEPRRC